MTGQGPSGVAPPPPDLGGSVLTGRGDFRISHQMFSVTATLALKLPLIVTSHKSEPPNHAA